MFVVIGTTTVDLIVRGSSSAGRGDGFRGDNLVFTDQPLLMLMGGNGGNSAYALARLGAPTALLSSVGQDELGDWLIGRLAAEQVDVSGVLRQAATATSSSTILMDSAEHQAVFHHSGASRAMELTGQHVAQCAAARALLIGSYPLLPKLRNEGFARALRAARVNGGLTALDIGPAIATPAKLDELIPLLPEADYLLANVHELAVCTGEADADWERGAAHLLQAGCRAVVIKRGDQGAALRTPAATLDVPAFPTQAHIAVGAGDSFNAGFLLGLADGRPAGDALRLGNAVAARVVAGESGVLSAPTLAAAEALLRA
jgi:sugar/nucleoside kinase (ribokinase family)